MNNVKLNTLEKNWVLYDVGNSAFTLIATTIIPLYFNSIAANAGIRPADYLAFWGYASSVATVIVAILGPISGAVSDGRDMKKRVFSLFLTVGVICNIIFALPMSWYMFLILFVIGKAAYSGSLVIYDAMLVDITSPKRMDSVSTSGFAWGYIFSCIPFAACLVVILFGEKIGVSTQVAFSVSFVITALWWYICSLPLLKTYRQVHINESLISVGKSFKNLLDTYSEIRKNNKIRYFLIAFFFYIDGVYTIINMAVAYGGSLGLDSTGLLLALLVTQIVAFPSALFFGHLSSRYKTSSLILVCIVAYFFITLFAMQLDNLVEFWILAVGVGLFQGAVQALSRSYFSKIIPPEKSGKYFGIYDICGKGAAFLGTFLISIISQISGNQSLGIGVLPVMFLVGVVFFIKAEKYNAYKI